MSLSMGRICRKHFTKIVIAVAVIYLISAVHFFGNVNEKKESKKGSPTKHESTMDVVLPEEKTAKRVATTSSKVEVVYQPIDLTEEHRQLRLQTLKEIYAIPHQADADYKLNESRSRSIDLDRPPTDLRPDRCMEIKYDLDTLPTVSLIIPIYNEALSMILRALHSVINNTPQKLLVDVILVDDDSKLENLKAPLDKYISLLPAKVKVLRNSKREGLIRARMRGAAIATGEVLMFQDAHTEFSPGWAEAALSYIQKHPNTIVQPVVEELQVNKISWPDR